MERTVHAAGDRSVAIGGPVTDSYIHTGDLILQITLRVRALSTDYATRIQNFLHQYLGTEQKPVPFGGRGEALADLERWLEDASAPPYLLLAAPAGRGKSALLVHWSQRLLTRQREAAEEQDLAVVFFPVSVRFRTNLAGVAFPALVAQLAALHEEDVSEQVNTPVEVWRDLLARYLSRPLPEGKRLLLILDGVDESADWEVGADLVPHSPPRGVRVVLSARLTTQHPTAEAWLEHLGWAREAASTLELQPLDGAGVAEVLRGMGPHLVSLSEPAALVRQLLRLSQGDPLLVRLYVEDLARRAAGGAQIRAEDLAATPPGLDGYFKRWWEDQQRLWGEKAPLQEAGVRTLLNLLSCALGPLRRDDLLELLPPEAGLDSWMLEEALRPLGRFVVGDGEEQGYVFSHPRLAEHFFTRLSPKERSHWEARFLAWAETVLAALNEKRLPSAEAPPYVVQYYGAHLQRAGATVELLSPLVSEGWWRAWLALEGSYAGFLTDVDRVWAAAQKANRERLSAGKLAEHLGLEVLSSLCQASVSSFSENLPSSLPAALVKNGLWTITQAVAYVARVGKPHVRANALLALASIAPASQKSDLAARTISAAAEMRYADRRTEVLTKLADVAPESERCRILKAAMSAAEEISIDPGSVKVLVALADRVAGRERDLLLSRAITAAKQMWNPRQRALALTALAPHLDEREQRDVLAEAFAAIRALVLPEERVFPLARLAKHLAEPERTQALTALLDTDLAGESLEEVAPLLSHEQRSVAIERARDAAHEINLTDDTLVDRLVNLAKQASGAQRAAIIEETLAASERLWDRQKRIEVLVVLSSLLEEPERSMTSSNALDLARQIDDPVERLSAYLKTIPNFAEDRRHDLLTEAISLARDIRVGWHAAWMLSTLAEHARGHQRSALLEAALSAAERIGDDVGCAFSLVALLRGVPASIQRQLWEEVRGTVPEIESVRHLKGSDVSPVRMSENEPLLELHSAWRSTLSQKRNDRFGSRNSLFAQLTALADIADKLGGGAARVSMIKAIIQVKRWWP